MAQPNYGSPWRRWLPRWSRAQSLLTILIAAVYADHDRDLREDKTLEAIIMRSRTVRSLSRAKLDEVLEKVHRETGLEKWSPEPSSPRDVAYMQSCLHKALTKATRAFFRDPALRQAVYLQALDILRADQTMLQSEKGFYERLAAMLTLTPQERSACETLIRQKNAH